VIVAVGQHGHAEARCRLGQRQVVDDRPDLAALRVDEAVHAVGRVEADGQVDGARLDRLGGLVGAGGRQQGADHERGGN